KRATSEWGWKIRGGRAYGEPGLRPKNGECQEHGGIVLDQHSGNGRRRHIATQPAGYDNTEQRHRWEKSNTATGGATECRKSRRQSRLDPADNPGGEPGPEWNHAESYRTDGGRER